MSCLDYKTHKFSLEYCINPWLDIIVLCLNNAGNIIMNYTQKWLKMNNADKFFWGKIVRNKKKNTKSLYCSITICHMTRKSQWNESILVHQLSLHGKEQVGYSTNKLTNWKSLYICVILYTTLGPNSASAAFLLLLMYLDLWRSYSFVELAVFNPPKVQNFKYQRAIW